MNTPSRELVEQLIEKLKGNGVSKVSSIIQVASHFNIGLDTAKVLVHESPAWSEQRKSHEELHEKLIDAMDGE